MPDRAPSTPADPAETRNVVDLLTHQHRQVESLLKALVHAQRDDERSALLVKAGDELAVHVSAEEVVFYPEVTVARTEDILLESLEEHLSLKRLLADLLALDPSAETFPPKCKVLYEQAEHHHKEEEENLFPKVRKLLDDAKLAHLGDAVRDHENKMRAAGDPRRQMAAKTAAAEPLIG